MADLTRLLTGLLDNLPSNGGLNATNYPNQWGLRAYKEGDGYGGDMMPKYTGWLGQQPNIAHPNNVSTELSVADDIGEFPSMTPNLDKEQLNRLLSLKDGQRMPNDIYNSALQFANQRRDKGLSPFKDVFDEMPKGLLNR
jgi:hypothetical protein